jgi:hypothetical protein
MRPIFLRLARPPSGTIETAKVTRSMSGGTRTRDLLRDRQAV